ncbi:PEP-CTERM sorting domain-containing protein [Betaproteobacteria bacterium PRO7]|nr:PEP-CTERM sorting domain-containing protein [Betaproteobacteria bacterium PRO7]
MGGGVDGLFFPDCQSPRGVTMKRVFAASLAALALGFGQFANAALLDGNCIEYQYLFPDSGNNWPSADNGLKCVGPGVEVTNIVEGVGTMDIFDDYILIDFTVGSSFTPASFNGFRLRDVTNTIAPFTSVTIDPSTNMIGLDASRISFDADNIFVNWQSLGFSNETIVRLNIGGGTVPEPASLLLLASGLLAVGAFARKGRPRQA